MNQIINLIFSAVIASSYVASIHSFKPLRLRDKDRNDLEVVSYRIHNVSILCVGLIVIEPFMIHLVNGDSWVDNFNQLHLVPTSWSDLINIMYCLLMILTLYIGPIFEYVIQDPHITQDFQLTFTNIWGFRDHVFAPLTEEIIYRSILVHILSLNFTKRSIILYSPLLFGIAHIHHGYELITIKKLNVSMVIANVIFQTIYTTLFGMLACYIFVKYNNVWCCVVIHSVCNIFGFPSLIEGGREIKVVYYSLLVMGVYLFYVLL